MEEGIVPLAGEDVHEIHAAGIGYLDGSDTPKEEGSDEGGDQGDAGCTAIGVWMEPADLGGGGEPGEERRVGCVHERSGGL